MKQQHIYKKIKSLTLFGTIGLVLAIHFTNCSNSKIQFSKSLESALGLQGTGNGTNYDGKPDIGTYYRLTSSQRCGTQIELLGKIEVRADSITGQLAAADSCALSTQPLNQNQIESNAYNREVIGFADGVYKKYERQPDLNNKHLSMAEAWCRIPSSSGSSGLDVVTTADSYGGQVASSVFMSSVDPSDNSQPAQFDIPGQLIRKATLSRIEYSGSDFQLSISTNTPPGTGAIKWQGHLVAKLANTVVDSPVECRVAGHLDTESTPKPLTCPLGFLELPPLIGYTNTTVCIAKYEAKQTGTRAVIQPQGLPWMNLNRVAAQSGCQEMGPGFDLVSNAEWQTLARNIEQQGENWSTGVVGSGALNEGQTNNNPATALEAPMDDTDPCYGVNQTCSVSQWNQKRRTHRLSTGALIWDVGGNAYEWTRDNNTQAYGPDGHMQAVGNAAPFVSLAKDLFGPAGDYLTMNTAPWGGLGYGYLNHSDGAIVRGAGFDENKGAGIFQTSLWFTPLQTWPSIGFRCSYYP